MIGDDCPLFEQNAAMEHRSYSGFELYVYIISSSKSLADSRNTVNCRADVKTFYSSCRFLPTAGHPTDDQIGAKLGFDLRRVVPKLQLVAPSRGIALL